MNPSHERRNEKSMNHNDERIDNPTAEADKLRATPKLLEGQASSTSQSVSLSANGGFFELSWNASTIGSYDWVGLYQNAELPDSDYIGGNNWQWATRGTSYKTSTAVQTGYQARYLVWDAVRGAYKSVARSAPWKG
jgi:hypothetical protein